MQTFINLPTPINDAINVILSRSTASELASNAKKIHEQYMSREKGNKQHFIQGMAEVQGYLSLRVPATYAQIYSALLQLQERIPHLNPTTLLDLGCGPGTGIWAAKTLWPSIAQATAIDREKYFLSCAQEILHDSKMDLSVSWKTLDIKQWIETTESVSYDLILVANVFNELSEIERERLMHQVSQRSSGVVVILEPGNSIGYPLIQDVAASVSKDHQLLGPYIHNSFVRSDDYWIHFPQRFQRPEYQRRIRQSMRENNLMASDWEETKYSYVAWGNITQQTNIWAQCIGPVRKQKGFLTLPILTDTAVEMTKILKRFKTEYTYAKNLQWGEVIGDQSDLIPTPVP